MMVRRLFGLAVLALVVLAPILGGATPRATASCAVAADNPDLLRRAGVIFTGDMVKDSTAKLGAEREYTFRVDKVYKGAAYSEQVVVTDNRGSEGLKLTGPGPYLVLSRFREGDAPGPATRLDTDRCQGTRAITVAAPVPASLGGGSAPALGSSRSVTSRFTGKLWVVAGVGCIAFAIIYTRRNSRRRHPERPD